MTSELVRAKAEEDVREGNVVEESMLNIMSVHIVKQIATALTLKHRFRCQGTYCKSDAPFTRSMELACILHKKFSPFVLKKGGNIS